MDHLRSGVQDQPDQHGEIPSPISTESTKKTSKVWSCTPVISTTQEAEAGELLELEKQRLQ